MTVIDRDEDASWTCTYETSRVTAVPGLFTVGMASEDIARAVSKLPCVSDAVLTNGSQSARVKKDDRFASNLNSS
jgi:hypothetical protein